ncbi:Hypothetical protein PHPALM_17924 [Phytophthora palmivora]|uniref:HAT C-terminal dimerisation domain-containing protein n=1 Tax=Phytophthora palmivora TaxID=4796 RepID=A0A2P4XL01_9STRA|nr:Hypothetical protein PHPALM_17924 [Phytophthora palmivora]
MTRVFSGGIAEFDEEADENLKDKCESEITLYLEYPVTTNPLKWWTKERRGKYPIIAALARKWLGCIATSVPSECSLDPDIVRDIVVVFENYKENDDNIPSGETDNNDDDSE